ncbi:MAG: T9SS type A sorting domain-containing protein [Bacteroidota bacterium]
MKYIHCNLLCFCFWFANSMVYGQTLNENTSGEFIGDNYYIEGIRTEKVSFRSHDFALFLSEDRIYGNSGDYFKVDRGATVRMGISTICNEECESVSFDSGSPTFLQTGSVIQINDVLNANEYSMNILLPDDTYYPDYDAEFEAVPVESSTITLIDLSSYFSTPGLYTLKVNYKNECSEQVVTYGPIDFNPNTPSIAIARKEDQGLPTSEKSTKRTLSTENLVLFPNPNDGRFSLKFHLEVPDLVFCTIVDLDGRIVFKTDSKSYEEGSHVMDIDVENSLASGHYILEIHSYSETIRRRFIMK